VRWKVQPPFPFRFQRLDSAFLVKEEARAAIRAAFYRWTDVTCADGRRTSLRFVEGDEIFEEKPLGPAPAPPPYGIFFRDRGWPHEGGDDQLAITNLEFAKATGYVSYADMEVNTALYKFSAAEVGDGVDLQAVLTHEVGHYIGLAHSREPSSIMAPNLCESGDRCIRDRVSSRRLGEDDQLAVCSLFPPANGAAAPPPDPGSACALTAAPPGHGWSVAATLGALGTALGLRRARRRPPR
jgi:hypothetical protein